MKKHIKPCNCETCKKLLRKTGDEVIKILTESTPAFFGTGKVGMRAFYEEKISQMITDVERYFYEKTKK